MAAKTAAPRVLFLDTGGVLLTNGWDREARARAAERFGLDRAELEDRHRLSFDAYENGKITLSQYVRWVVMNRRRDFSAADFESFMFEQSEAHSDAIAFFSELKARHGLRVVGVSNEGRELTEYRMRKFGLDELMDVAVASGFVHLRKPDPEIWRVALDLAQADPGDVVYVDDRAMFVEVAREIGIPSIQYTDLPSAKQALAEHGLG